MKPIPGYVLLTPFSERDNFADDLKARTGLHMPTAEFKGIPNQGIVYALPHDYDGELKKGDRVVFNDKAPQGVNFEGIKVIRIKLTDVQAVVNA